MRLVACLHDEHCETITVTSVETHGWPNPGRGDTAMPWRGDMVLCARVGGVKLESCDEDSPGNHSTIVMSRTRPTISPDGRLVTRA